MITKERFIEIAEEEGINKLGAEALWSRQGIRDIISNNPLGRTDEELEQELRITHKFMLASTPPKFRL